MKRIACLFTVAMLTLVGTSAARADQSIEEKAAFALGTTPENIAISNQHTDGDTVRFNATTNGRVFQCYYTGVPGVTSSDALCSPTDGKPLPTSAACNALLQAAGKC